MVKNVLFSTPNNLTWIILLLKNSRYWFHFSSGPVNDAMTGPAGSSKRSMMECRYYVFSWDLLRIPWYELDASSFEFPKYLVHTCHSNCHTLLFHSISPHVSLSPLHYGLSECWFSLFFFNLFIPEV